MTTELSLEQLLDYLPFYFNELFIQQEKLKPKFGWKKAKTTERLHSLYPSFTSLKISEGS